jgi:hypothetical protein
MKGRGMGNGGGFAPSLKSLPPLLSKERGIKGVRMSKTKGRAERQICHFHPSH